MIVVVVIRKSITLTQTPVPFRNGHDTAMTHSRRLQNNCSKTLALTKKVVTRAAARIVSESLLSVGLEEGISLWI